MKTKVWVWQCRGRDNRRVGDRCFHPDFEGYCEEKEGGFSSEAEANVRASSHKCRFKPDIAISKKTVRTRDVVILQTKKHNAKHKTRPKTKLIKIDDYRYELVFHEDDEVSITIEKRDLIDWNS